MDNPQIVKTIRAYLRFPIFTVIPLVILGVVLCVYDRKLILPVLVVLALYILVVGIIYVVFRKKFTDAIIQKALSMDSAGRAHIEEMPVPYAVINKECRIIWSNRAFKELTGGEEESVTTISKIFPIITKDTLKKSIEDELSLYLNYKDLIFRSSLIPFDSNQNADSEFTLYGFIMFDDTLLEEYKKRLDDERLVVANVYIDNYDEAVDSVEDVKQSLLKAVLERKIRKYFSEVDAVIRKLEKDKYFLIFPKRHLKKLEEDSFSILEDIKSTKVGNESEVTLSIGVGLGGDNYSKNADYAKTATSLALGRGGAQAVIKEGGEVTIFGEKGREVEKSTRVKARVKAQALKELMGNRERILVMGHKLSDFDCLGASIGIYCAAREMEKKCSIVINTVTSSLRSMLETFTENDAYPDDLIIDNEKAMGLVDSGTLLIIVDTNNLPYTECPELLEKTNDIVVIDHHRQGRGIIKNPILSYIEPYASSTCEMIAEILQYFSEDIAITPGEADAIFSGMLIDTNNFMSKTGVRTFEAAAYLRRCGAEVTRVRKLLREDINAYKARAEIVRSAQVYKNSFAIAVCDNTTLESPTIVGAQAANELLNIVGIKASFVLTDFNNRIFVSSRSIDEIDVQLIMERIGGGGHLHTAGAQIEGGTIEDTISRIHEILDSMIEQGEIK